MHGYPLALLAMMFAAVLPYFGFKWEKWLWHNCYRSIAFNLET